MLEISSKTLFQFDVVSVSLRHVCLQRKEKSKLLRHLLKRRQLELIESKSERNHYFIKIIV